MSLKRIENIGFKTQRKIEEKLLEQVRFSIFFPGSLSAIYIGETLPQTACYRDIDCSCIGFLGDAAQSRHNPTCVALPNHRHLSVLDVCPEP
jgi:hypothetical protein